MGSALEKKTACESEAFLFRVKTGEHEVELRGAHQEVIKTLERLPELIAKVNQAFECAKPKTAANPVVKLAEEPKLEAKQIENPTQKMPKIAITENVDHAALRILESEWGKWRPRTEAEMKEVLQASALRFSDRAFSGALEALSKKGMVRRWNTNSGSVYILAEKNTKAGSKR